MRRMTSIAVGLLTGLLVTGTAMAESQGRVSPGEERVLGVAVSGVVEHVAVAIGDRVEAGDELLRLDATTFEADLAAARAGEEAARLARDEARAEYDRARTLYDRNQIAENELEIARKTEAIAEADYQSARAERVRREWRMERTRLRAPVAGEVVAVKAFPGQTVVARHVAPEQVILRFDKEAKP